MSHVLEEGVATDNGLFNGESRFACGWAWCSFTCLATFPRGILWQSSTDTGSRREGKSCPKEAEGRGYGYVGGRRKTVVSVMWRCGASMSRQLPLDNAVSNADIRDERGRGSGGGGTLGLEMCLNAVLWLADGKFPLFAEAKRPKARTRGCFSFS